MDLQQRMSDIRVDDQLGAVGTIPLFPQLPSSKMIPEFERSRRRASPSVRRIKAYALPAFQRVPWALTGDPVQLELEQLPQALSDLGLDMQVRVASDSSSATHPEAAGQNPDEVSEAGARTIVFRRPSTTELNAGYTDADYILATPTVVDSPLGRSLPKSRTLFGGTNPQNEITLKLSATDANLDTPFYGDASDIISRIVEGGASAVGTAANKISNLNLSPEAKKILGAVGAGLVTVGGLKLGGKFLPSLMMRNALKSGVQGMPSAASEAVVADALWHGASGNTTGVPGYRAIYDVPMDFWRTLFALGDVYENTAAQPHFGLLEGDPSEEVLQTALFGLRAPDIYLTADGRMVHSPVPYAATVLAGGLFSKIKSAAKKVATAATKVVAKVASNPLVKTAATAMGMGGVVNAVEKGAKAASALLDSDRKESTSAPAPAEPTPLAAEVQDQIAPVDASGDGPTESSIKDATVDDIKTAVAKSMSEPRNGQIPGTWKDYLDGKRVTPEAFAEAMLTPDSPLSGNPFAVAAVWLAKQIAIMAAFEGGAQLVGKIAGNSSPKADSAPGSATANAIESGTPVTASSAKGGWRQAVARVGSLLRKSGGWLLGFVAKNPKLAGAVAVAMGFWAVGNRLSKKRDSDYAHVLATLREASASVNGPDKEEIQKMINWMVAHQQAIISGAQLSDADSSALETCYIVAGQYALHCFSESLPMSSHVSYVYDMYNAAQAELAQSNPAQFQEVASAAAATFQNATANNMSATTPSNADSAFDAALGGSTPEPQSSSNLTGSMPSGDEDVDAATEEFITNPANESLMQDATLAALSVDVTGLSDAEADVARQKAMEDYIMGNSNTVSAAVAASVAGSLLAMLVAKGLAKGKVVAQSALDKARDWWRSNILRTQEIETALPAQSFSVGV